jgi:hypothetical protein
MYYRAFKVCAAALVASLHATPASAQVYFADNFEAATDSTTFIGNSSIGGDPNGDADPNMPQSGAWIVTEPQPWKIQVTQGNTAGSAGSASFPGPGPAGGVNALAIERFQGSTTEARANFASAATGLVSVEFDLWINYGEAQVFPRNGTDFGYSGYPILVNFMTTGQVRVDNGAPSAPFYTVDTGTGPADIEYNHVEFLIDMTAQTFSLSVDGATLPALTNVAFPSGAAGTEPASQLQQFAFGEPTGEGVFYVDNLVVQAVPEPASVGLVALAGVGVMALRRRWS